MMMDIVLKQLLQSLTPAATNNGLSNADGPMVGLT